MAHLAALLAARDLIAEDLNLSVGSGCGVTMTGRPPGSAGPLFVAVHPATVSARELDADGGGQDAVEFDVTASLLGGHRGDARFPLSGVRAGEGMIALASKVRRAVCRPDAFASAVARLLRESGAPGSVSGSPRHRRTDPPRERGADWWEREGDGPIGVTMTLRFDGLLYCYEPAADPHGDDA
ncbi:hypothetical protein [Alienimonas sp. DA493]|uniref:hypothetical protein n=1 Tax=Alienimonas sp. DA493 TaxID=3373605 RepID=UPI0037547EB6